MDLRRLGAYHEAAHVVVAHVLGVRFSCANCEIDDPDHPERNRWKTHFRQQGTTMDDVPGMLAALWAGHAAEVLCGEVEQPRIEQHSCKDRAEIKALAEVLSEHERCDAVRNAYARAYSVVESHPRWMEAVTDALLKERCLRYDDVAEIRARVEPV